MYVTLNPDFDITEIKDIECKVNGTRASCTYCCSSDSLLVTRIVLTYNDGMWGVEPNKESPPEENIDQ
jgi:hypothetical protein